VLHACSCVCAVPSSKPNGFCSAYETVTLTDDGQAAWMCLSDAFRVGIPFMRYAWTLRVEIKETRGVVAGGPRRWARDADQYCNFVASKVPWKVSPMTTEDCSPSRALPSQCTHPGTRCPTIPGPPAHRPTFLTATARSYWAFL
jgi:hypothetical protein